MAYDEELAMRVREVVSGTPGLTEKAMFGGIAFMVRGNMAVGVSKEDLMVRVGPDEHEAALSRPHVKPFDMTGRPMKGWVVVTPGGIESEQDLRQWVDQGVEFAQSLPPK
jgi:TfoX/Sxy family transcriptional regulator of competence genes